MSLRWARLIERRVRKFQSRQNRGAVFILVSDADSVDTTPTARTFGLAHRATSIILYHPAIARAAGREGQPHRWKLEATVLEHELGHLLGLVNTANPDPTQPAGHEAQDSPHHCAQPGCLMHANALGALAIAGATRIDGIPPLCDTCRATLQKTPSP
jgi:hypothetical protein